MPRIIKPGFKPKPNPRRSRAQLKLAEERKQTKGDELAERRERKQDQEALGIKSADPRTKQVAQARRGIKSSANDPTLLRTVEFCLSKAAMGFTYRQISMAAEDELGYPITALKVKRYVEAEMEKRKAPLISEIRKQSDLRLAYLTTQLELKVKLGDVQAIHEARLLDESRRKLFGADMPANVRVTGEIEHKLDPAVAQMIEDSKARIRAEQENAAKRQLEDPAIIDAEVVDDEPDYKAEPYHEDFQDEEIEGDAL